jgi:hypothetical protein
MVGSGEVSIVQWPRRRVLIYESLGITGARRANGRRLPAPPRPNARTSASAQLLTAAVAVSMANEARHGMFFAGTARRPCYSNGVTASGDPPPRSLESHSYYRQSSRMIGGVVRSLLHSKQPGVASHDPIEKPETDLSTTHRESRLQLPPSELWITANHTRPIDATALPTVTAAAVPRGVTSGAQLKRL